MDRLNTRHIQIGAWQVNPLAGQISRQGETLRLEARTLRLLLHLAERAGQVVSIDELLNEVWTGVVVTPDSVYQAIAALRRLLGDDAKQPSYIATVPRLGYRLVAAVSWVEADPELAAPKSSPAPRPAHAGALIGAIIAIALAGAPAVSLKGNASRPATAAHDPVLPHTIAVLAFRDLTSEAMDQEYFADGMTEELIDRLSQTPGFQVASPASSFYFKDRHVPLADIASALHVRFLLDGSIRKSEHTLRIAARLIRAADGFVLWSHSYDRAPDDELAVQRDIAAQVSGVLEAAIN